MTPRPKRSRDPAQPAKQLRKSLTQRKPVGMPIFRYFATVGVLLGGALFFAVDILRPPEGLPVTAAAVSREPSKLERAVMERKAEQEREAARQAAAELQKVEAEREAFRATPQRIVAPPPAGELPPDKPRTAKPVERSHKQERSAKSNRDRPDVAAHAANLALGYGAEPPRRSFLPFGRVDTPY